MPTETDLRAQLASLIKELKRLEEENSMLHKALKEASAVSIEKTRSQALQDFFRDMNHDIMTPISSIKASIYLITKLNDPQKIKTYAQVLDIQIQHLQDLLENLLQMNRLDMGLTDFKIQQVDVRMLVREIWMALSSQVEKKDQTLIQDYGDTPIPKILADKVKLYQALMNIGQNAINYTPAYGCITISLQATPSEVIIRIQDTGIGIDTEDLPYIFNRFFRGDRARNTQLGSSGLGLAISKKIITSLRGRIEVESVVGQGTCFTISIPHIEQSANLRRSRNQNGTGISEVAPS